MSVDLSGEFNELSQHPFDRGTDQPVGRQPIRGHIPKLSKLVKPLADRYQSPLDGFRLPTPAEQSLLRQRLNWT